MKIELISGFESGAKRERIVLDAGETTDAAGSTKKVWRGPGFFCRLTHADGAREDYHGMVPDAAGYGAAVLTDRPERRETSAQRDARVGVITQSQADEVDGLADALDAWDATTPIRRTDPTYWTARDAFRQALLTKKRSPAKLVGLDANGVGIEERRCTGEHADEEDDGFVSREDIERAREERDSTAGAAGGRDE